jgi:general secretion pathway protein N
MRWLALVVFFVLALAALAPATLLDARLERASSGRLRLAEAQGTVWSGSGWIEARDAHGGAGVARRLAWRVLPESLLRGRLLVQVELEPDAKPFRLALSPSRIDIADAAISLPAAALALGVPRLARLRLTGEVRVSIPQLSFEGGRIDGYGTLQWRSAGSALTPVSPLGAYEVQFKTVGPAMHAALRTLEGPLELDGRGAWSSGEPPRFFATARLPPQVEEQLAPLFRLFAAERGAGTFELRL